MMSLEFLQIVWYALVGVLLAGFLICSGFDFGAGMVSGFLKNPSRRETAMKEIAPFWDGNQVWLVTAGGALFASFPKAYSAVLSQAYVPVILLLAFLVFRVAAIEFFLSADGARWRAFWSKVCAVSSIAAMLLAGIALGAMFGGQILLPRDGGFWRYFSGLFAPITVGAGVLTVAFCASHGASYLALKNPNDAVFTETAKRASIALTIVFLAYFGLFAYYANSFDFPRVFSMVLMVVSYVALSASMRLSRRNMFKTSFALSSLFAIFAVAAHMAAAYPYLVCPLDDSQGCNMFHASSTAKTLQIMLAVAVAGVPIALAYFIYAHFVFSKSRAVSKEMSGY